MFFSSVVDSLYWVLGFFHVCGLGLVSLEGKGYFPVTIHKRQEVIRAAAHKRIQYFLKSLLKMPKVTFLHLLHKL